jgi:chromosomal replication initiation ATPase DnaA
MTPIRQLALDLALPERYGREDFLEAPCNAKALALIESWPAWPSPVLALIGPPGSGRSHLGAIWAEHAHASVLPAMTITRDGVPQALTSGALLIEDAGPGLDEAAFFHLLNAAKESNAFLLITAAEAPAAWGVALPDLLSRLRAIPLVELGPPDDHLLRAVLVKLSADRQLVMDAETVEFCARRMDRSLASARALIAALDTESLASSKKVSRGLAARVLERFGWH